MTPETSSEPVISFVVIGYNEAPTLEACIRSVHEAELPGVPYEVIFVDGGSQDDSIGLARQTGVDQVLGGERQRKAAENRNLGMRHARGEYVQFLDGDMAIHPGWPGRALSFLEEHPEAAIVAGRLEEANHNLWFRAMQLDWTPETGVVESCGGGAMHRRAVLDKMGGFPEDVAYGEEPYLCWRIRNELGMQVHQLDELMAYHDLGFSGLRDYWRRCARAGATYAEIAVRCAASNDRLWFAKAFNNVGWAVAILAGAVLLCVGPWWMRVAVLAAAGAVLVRKSVQTLRKGQPLPVALAYAVHTYFAKLPLAYGQLRWLAGRFARGK